jgi:hypothetical protein
MSPVIVERETSPLSPPTRLPVYERESKREFEYEVTLSVITILPVTVEKTTFPPFPTTISPARNPDNERVSADELRRSVVMLPVIVEKARFPPSPSFTSPEME